MDLRGIYVILQKHPKFLDKEIITYLIYYIKYINRNVSQAARSILNHFKDTNSQLLDKRLRGNKWKSTEKLDGDDDNFIQLIKVGIDGAELLQQEQEEKLNKKFDIPIFCDRILTDEDFKRIRALKRKKEAEIEQNKLQEKQQTNQYIEQEEVDDDEDFQNVDDYIDDDISEISGDNDELNDNENEEWEDEDEDIEAEDIDDADIKTDSKITKEQNKKRRQSLSDLEDSVQEYYSDESQMSEENPDGYVREEDIMIYRKTKSEQKHESQERKWNKRIKNQELRAKQKIQKINQGMLEVENMLKGQRNRNLNDCMYIIQLIIKSHKMNSEQEMIFKKRELFRVQIRRKQNELIFQQKRQLFNESLNSQDWQTPMDQIFQQAIESKIITPDQKRLSQLFTNLKNIIRLDYSINSNLKSFLSYMFFNLQYLQLNEQENWITDDFLDVIIICLQDVQQTFQDLEENENTLDFDQKLFDLLNHILIFISSLSSQLTISIQSTQFKQIVLFIITILHYLYDMNQFEIVCKLIINIVLERSEEYISLIQQSIFPQILIHKYEELNLQQNYKILYQIYLYFGQITGICKLKYGTQLFQDTYQLSNIINSIPLNADQNYYSCVEQYLYFLYNITLNIEENKPRTYQLFNILIDKEIVMNVSNFLLQLRYEFEEIHEYGYKFLLNLSMIQSSYSMEKLISQNVFKLVLFQINHQTSQQYLIYPLFSNLLTTNKEQTKQMIFDSGILGKTFIGFQTALNNHSYQGCLEIIQCIINMFQNINLQQQLQLIQKGMVECLFDYIIKQEIDQLDLKTVEEIYGTLYEQKQLNPQLQFKEEFRNKSEKIYENLDDDCDIAFFINNIINITD